VLTVLVALLKELGWLQPACGGKGGRGEQRPGPPPVTVTPSPMLEAEVPLCLQAAAPCPWASPTTLGTLGMIN